MQRVAFIDGPIDIPFAEMPDVLVDLVSFEWQFIAEAIVNDLVTLEALTIIATLRSKPKHN